MATQDSNAVADSRYFTVQADIGITKHMGGRKATDELVALCEIGPGQLVLEIVGHGLYAGKKATDGG